MDGYSDEELVGKVIEILEKLMGALKENRQKWGEELGQAYERVKGTREERKIKEIVWSDNGYKYWEAC